MIGCDESKRRERARAVCPNTHHQLRMCVYIYLMYSADSGARMKELKE